jgi:hypothetical protein
MASVATMKVDAFLADSAVVPPDGKLYAQGAGWNMLWCQNFPTRHARMCIGLVITVPWTATNHNHELSVHLEDGDGQTIKLGDGPEGEVKTIGGNFNIGRPPVVAAGDDQLIAMAMTLDGLEFDHPDRYLFVVSIDGTPLNRLPLRVGLLPNANPLVTGPAG